MPGVFYCTIASSLTHFKTIPPLQTVLRCTSRLCRLCSLVLAYCTHVEEIAWHVGVDIIFAKIALVPAILYFAGLLQEYRHSTNV